MMRIVRAAVDVLRLATAREKLGDAEAPSASLVSPPDKGVLHVLFVSREPLGIEPEAAPRPRASLLRALFAPEELPRDPVAPPARPRPSLLRALFGSEELPRDPEPPPARRRGRLATIFSLEKLDDSL